MSRVGDIRTMLATMSRSPKFDMWSWGLARGGTSRQARSSPRSWPVNGAVWQCQSQIKTCDVTSSYLEPSRMIPHHQLQMQTNSSPERRYQSVAAPATTYLRPTYRDQNRLASQAFSGSIFVPTERYGPLPYPPVHPSMDPGVRNFRQEAHAQNPVTSYASQPSANPSQPMRRPPYAWNQQGGTGTSQAVDGIVHGAGHHENAYHGSLPLSNEAFSLGHGVPHNLSEKELLLLLQAPPGIPFRTTQQTPVGHRSTQASRIPFSHLAHPPPAEQHYAIPRLGVYPQQASPCTHFPQIRPSSVPAQVATQMNDDRRTILTDPASQQPTVVTPAFLHGTVPEAPSAGSTAGRSGNITPSKVPWPCPVPDCSASYSRPQDRERHIRETHLPRWLYCSHPGCSWTGTRQYALDVHLKRHKGISPPNFSREIYDPSPIVKGLIRGETSIEQAVYEAKRLVLAAAVALGRQDMWKESGLR
ncbi:hypothetical protein BC834DRAFT_582871 [Gloeopeniophorella convolvens]|nr:hypothetical protein BC834DRAFT_582871 [Gloeopeniophorella convolvens]